jgi:hypothetical protein
VQPINNDNEDLLAWEDVDDRVMAQRIRRTDSTITLKVVGLNIRCHVEITSAAKDIHDYLCRRALWFDSESIATWMTLVGVLTQPGCLVLHRMLHVIREKILKGERMVFKDEGDEEEEDEYDDGDDEY